MATTQSVPNLGTIRLCLYSKRGFGVTVDEALVTEYVRLNTTIPVPTILDVLPYPGRGGVYIIMTCLPGRQVVELPRGSLDEYSVQEMDVFVTTISGWLEQLRALGPSPYGDSVCGFTGGPFHSFRIKHDDFVGPYASQKEFFSQYWNTLPEEADPDIKALGARLRKEKQYKICLTHGDISPNNILLDDHYRPVALIDWGCAAWMPEYWELTYALYPRQRYAGWVKAFTRILPQYQDEFKVELEQWKYIFPW
ncbi:kinase-like domain-containing protein [Irpex lacteus]|nr:kinase-like domain-containing protein [Irpex lacteus]